MCECGTCERCKGREYARAYRARNPGANAATRRRYRASHLEQAREADRAAAAEKRRTDPDGVRAAKREWVRQNPEKVREQRRRARAARPAAHAASAAKWKAKNPELAREIQNRATRAYRGRKRATRTDPVGLAAADEMLTRDPCAYCGGVGEHYDHIVAVNAGGEHAATNLTRACASCNSRKRDLPLLIFMLRIRRA